MSAAGRRAGAADGRGVRPAGRVAACPGGAAARPDRVPFDPGQRGAGDADAGRRDARPAGRRPGPLDAALAREIYLQAIDATVIVGPGPYGLRLPEVAEAARSAPPPPKPPRALEAFRVQDSHVDDGRRWLWTACRTAMALFDDETWYVLAGRHVRAARQPDQDLDAGGAGVGPLHRGQARCDDRRRHDGQRGRGEHRRPRRGTGGEASDRRGTVGIVRPFVARPSRTPLQGCFEARTGGMPLASVTAT